MSHFEITQQMQATINSILVGKEEVVEQILTALLAGGHVLLEDVPGVGKTTLASLLAAVMECSFGRIQFTPDTLPGDIEGISIYNLKSGEFEYRPGVVMNQVLLADEINRTSPKTQASLLEAMNEGQVTVDGTVYPLPKPFMVVATQNPIEFLGTYPLPEAQLDRFMMRLTIGYPERDEEIRMAAQHLSGVSANKITPVCKAADVLAIQAEVAKVIMQEKLLAYITDIVRLTREEERYVLGASPRALLHLVKAAQATAYLAGRDYCLPDDVKKVAPLVLAHRLALTPAAKLQESEPAAILKSLIVKAVVPIL
ncbi:MAG: MoxR family ATPase [Lachnospiraceae bacterium]|jgi:MoxR-like ATPase|nr:MoxR family ATPase [Lachnospiraceae bacterium]